MSPPALGGDARSPLRPYEAVGEHAELELELAGRGDVESLVALGARWDELVAELPATPPAAAAELLQRARLIHERTRIELIRLRDALLTDLSTATRARRAADGYAGQLRRRPRLDRSA
ncbi:MAG TPA: hypothetical protein VK778_02135 [Solirubrobacteraceae bacterium]|nr:hypothetical protein [Solirubrobacteraceae bacterium]